MWEIFLVQAHGLGGSAEIKVPAPMVDGRVDLGRVWDMVDFYSDLGMDEVRIERLIDGEPVPTARIC
ncbi:MAG: hypothetical protein SVS15_11330 [Thermodesulfobacteriota bacterium]|nr:hypothetical protein [Thermodesulfobacteriota bacterium]